MGLITLLRLATIAKSFCWALIEIGAYASIININKSLVLGIAGLSLPLNIVLKLKGTVVKQFFQRFLSHSITNLNERNKIYNSARCIQWGA